MPCSDCIGVERRFSSGTARRQLNRYRKRGVRGPTKTLVESIRELDVEGATLLDIGGGVGAVHHELIDAGASGGVAIDASSGYVVAAREEAERRGNADRMRYELADFVEAQDSVPASDVVTLDRVVCCYPDMPALVDASASRARRVYGLVYPRDRALMRFAIGLVNVLHWLVRHPFRAYVHRTGDVERRVASHGLTRSRLHTTLVWQVAIFTRPSPTPGD